MRKEELRTNSMWTTTGLSNESDVEQKFIYPFFVEPRPLGLGLPPAAIQTKANIRRMAIGKGAEQKAYYPDYLVVTMGFPIIVAEAKNPSESIEDAHREARLYAAELNALYGHGIAPARFVVACNGRLLSFGHSDDASPLAVVDCDTLGPYSDAIARLLDLMSWERIGDLAAQLAQRIRPVELFKPRRMLGGLLFQNEEVGQNSFGATLTTVIAPIFNPTSADERAFVARNAYIASKRRLRYIDPIDRVIRAARGPSDVDATELADTAEPAEVIGQLRQPKELEHKILLLIGSVGSGKSTFIDHLCEVALPRELMEATVWCRLNMNAAPVSTAEIYTWLRREIVTGCRASVPGRDFDDLEIMRKVFSVELRKFAKGVGKLYESQPAVYDIKLGEHLERLLQDDQVVANAHVRFTCAERGKLLIVVLDNCDKKTRDEQLLMFEAAQWLQKEFRCLVVLPLRDETYDNHRDQPPLDTALKDLVFRIEPPLFQDILIRRTQLALKKLASEGNEKLYFSLPNGFQVEYPKSEQAFYLTSILKSLFEHDRFARRMIVGLAGRNMRRALEIFLEFCNSGHIGEDQIFKIRQSEGAHTLPLHQVATVLIRMNRRFYDSDHSYIKNLFAANKDDPLPAYFCRYMILRWLRENFRGAGTGGLKGYFPKGEIKHALIPHGVAPDVLDREFNYLLSAQCIVAEHLRLDSVDDADLVRLGPAGFVHLDLIGNINYLAAVAEDTFFSERARAERVVERIRSLDSQLRVKTVVDNAHEALEYLEAMRKDAHPPNGSYLEPDYHEQLTDLGAAAEALHRVTRSLTAADPWFDADRRLPRGSRHRVTVTNEVDFGYFVEFDDGLVGLIHRTHSGGQLAAVGDRVEIEVIWVDTTKHKMSLQLIAIVEEDAGDTVSGVFVAS